MTTYTLIVDNSEGDHSETPVSQKTDRDARRWLESQTVGQAIDITECDEVVDGVRVIARVICVDDGETLLTGRLIVG